MTTKQSAPKPSHLITTSFLLVFLLVLTAASEARLLTYDLMDGVVNFSGHNSGGALGGQHPITENLSKVGKMVIEVNPPVFYPDSGVIRWTDILSYSVSTQEYTFNGSGRLVLLGQTGPWGDQIFDYNEGYVSGCLVSQSYSGPARTSGYWSHFCFHEDGTEFRTLDEYIESVPYMMYSFENSLGGVALPPFAILAHGTGPVPEPSNLALVGIGLAGLAYVKTRTKS